MVECQRWSSRTQRGIPGQHRKTQNGEEEMGSQEQRKQGLATEKLSHLPDCTEDSALIAPSL